MIDKYFRSMGYCAETRRWGTFATCVCGVAADVPHAMHVCIVEGSDDCGGEWPNESFGSLDAARLKQAENRATHKHVTKVGEGELAYCEDCYGGEIDLWEASCEERQAKGSV